MIDHADKNKRYLVLAGSEFDFQTLSQTLDAPWMGAVFPAIFDENTLLCYDEAFLCELGSHVNLQWVGKASVMQTYRYTTHLVIADGIDPHISSKLETLFAVTAEKSLLFGGGAGGIEGTMLYMYNGKTLDKEGIIVLSADTPFGVGVDHGIVSTNECYIVTKATKNVIEEIDAQKAFIFYKTKLKELFGVEVSTENIFDMGLRYPLVFEHTFGEKIIRIPVGTDGEKLFFVGDVNSDTGLSIANVTQKDLLSAPQTAVIEAVEQLDKKIDLCIVFTCLGRQTYLGKLFKKEIQQIQDKIEYAPIVGVLSMGEIANLSDRYLEFHNCTCVVGVE